LVIGLPFEMGPFLFRLGQLVQVLALANSREPNPENEQAEQCLEASRAINVEVPCLRCISHRLSFLARSKERLPLGYQALPHDSSLNGPCRAEKNLLSNPKATIDFDTRSIHVRL
jgi:hypothetical protein